MTNTQTNNLNEDFGNLKIFPKVITKYLTGMSASFGRDSKISKIDVPTPQKLNKALLAVLPDGTTEKIYMVVQNQNIFTLYSKFDGDKGWDFVKSFNVTEKKERQEQRWGGKSFKLYSKDIITPNTTAVWVVGRDKKRLEKRNTRFHQQNIKDPMNQKGTYGGSSSATVDGKVFKAMVQQRSKNLVSKLNKRIEIVAAKNLSDQPAFELDSNGLISRNYGHTETSLSKKMLQGFGFGFKDDLRDGRISTKNVKEYLKMLKSLERLI